MGRYRQGEVGRGAAAMPLLTYHRDLFSGDNLQKRGTIPTRALSQKKQMPKL